MLLKKIKLSEVEIIGWIPPKVELIHNLKEKTNKLCVALDLRPI